jgi:spermidine synthase
MAILWQKRTAQSAYEVRSAGSSVRLYTNGVFHSQYNPRRPVTGGVWDLLMLPAFFHPPGTIRRVLLLGVGGGAVIRQLQQFVRPASIVGVELDPVHLHVARRYFGAGGKGVALVCADAVTWVHAYRGAAFDLIIDDLYGARDGEPVRAVRAGARWLRRVATHLAPRGSMVTNFVSPEELRACAYFTSEWVRQRFAAAFRLTTPRDENAVGVFLRAPATPRTLRHNLGAVPALDRTRKTCRLRYSIRRL